ncbi:unnamed protein product, partial [Closterium sp. NIES-54]
VPPPAVTWRASLPSNAMPTAASSPNYRCSFAKHWPLPGCHMSSPYCCGVAMCSGRPGDPHRKLPEGPGARISSQGGRYQVILAVFMFADWHSSHVPYQSG